MTRLDIINDAAYSQIVISTRNETCTIKPETCLTIYDLIPPDHSGCVPRESIPIDPANPIKFEPYVASEKFKCVSSDAGVVIGLV